MSPKYLDHVHSDTQYQSDIDHAFDDMFSALEECKQVMKDEANEHYQSLATIFKSKKQQLEKYVPVECQNWNCGRTVYQCHWVKYTLLYQVPSLSIFLPVS